MFFVYENIPAPGLLRSSSVGFGPLWGAGSAAWPTAASSPQLDTCATESKATTKPPMANHSQTSWSWFSSPSGKRGSSRPGALFPRCSMPCVASIAQAESGDLLGQVYLKQAPDFEPLRLVPPPQSGKIFSPAQRRVSERAPMNELALRFTCPASTPDWSQSKNLENCGS